MICTPKVRHFWRCIITTVITIKAGTATVNKRNGADWWIKYNNKLPEYYISFEEAKKAGYRQHLGNLAEVAEGKMLAKGIYKNRSGKLPSAEGRVWYEADINYSFGYRDNQRIVYSNDGLIFVTFDHYMTFYEIV